MNGQARSEGQHRVALVMAASKGLGRASAEELARSGFDLMLCSRDRLTVAKVAEDLQRYGIRAAGEEADVSQADHLERLFDSADRQFGRLDVLVSNAGGPPAGSLESIDDDTWEKAFQLTLMSVVRSVRLALPLMRRNGFGRVVIVGSSTIRQPVDGLLLSNVLRPGVNGLVKSIAPELARDGITINIVSPGRIDTERVRSLDQGRAASQGVDVEEIRSSQEGAIPMGRYGRPEELAALVGFLASDAAGYITAQHILVDGGMVTALP